MANWRFDNDLLAVTHDVLEIVILLSGDLTPTEIMDLLRDLICLDLSNYDLGEVIRLFYDLGLLDMNQRQIQ